MIEYIVLYKMVRDIFSDLDKTPEEIEHDREDDKFNFLEEMNDLPPALHGTEWSEYGIQLRRERWKMNDPALKGERSRVRTN